MKEFKFTRNVFHVPHLEVKTFMPAPLLMHSANQSNTDSITFSVIVNLTLIFQYTTGNYKDAYIPNSFYTMNINNFRKTRRCFSKALKWFEDSQYSDLFYYTSDNHLEFNMERNDERAVVPISKRGHSMELRPIIIESNMGRREGVAFTINHSDHTVCIDWEDFVVLADIVLNFDFRSEALLLLNSFQVGSQLENFCTPQEMKMARDINRGQKVDPFKQS